MHKLTTATYQDIGQMHTDSFLRYCTANRIFIGILFLIRGLGEQFKYRTKKTNLEVVIAKTYHARDYFQYKAWLS